MEYRVTIVPQQEPNVFDIKIERKDGDSLPSFTPIRNDRTERRKKTKESLHRWTKNTSLTMWMSDLAIEFNPDQPNYFDEVVRPELEKRRISYCWNDIARFKPQVDSLKRFILLNFPGVVSTQVTDLVSTFEADQELNEKEKLYLEQIKRALDKPKQLLQLQRLAKRSPNNRVKKALVSCDVLKPSYTNIKVD